MALEKGIKGDLSFKSFIFKRKTPVQHNVNVLILGDSYISNIISWFAFLEAKKENCENKLRFNL